MAVSHNLLDPMTDPLEVRSRPLLLAGGGGGGGGVAGGNGHDDNPDDCSLLAVVVAVVVVVHGEGNSGDRECDRPLPSAKRYSRNAFRETPVGGR